MTQDELPIGLSIAADQHDRGEELNVDTIAKLTKKLAAVHYGGVEAHGREVLAGVFGRFGTLHDDAETAKAALQIAPGPGRSPVSPKRPSAWAARQAVVVRDETVRRRRWRPAAAIAAGALLLLVGQRSGNWPILPASDSVHSSFAELIDELGGDPKMQTATSAAMNASSGSWVNAWAADFAKGYRRCRSRDSAAREADAVTKRLLAFASNQKIKVEFVCPPPRRDGTKLAGDYRWPRQIRLCPGYTGIEGAALVAHELAHHLQGVAGRLGRKSQEDEADAVAISALKALWLPVHASDGSYLAKPGDHIPALVESRAKIEAMATELLRAAEGPAS